MNYITAKNLSVEFPLFTNPSRSLKGKVLHATTGGRFASSAGSKDVVRALDNINLEVKAGERIGLIGHNGSGKTTLLRVLAGAYEPVGGKLQVRGRVASLLDLSLGMDHDATGYENIFLRGIMMGLLPKEIRALTEEIAAFTELGEYLDMPVRTYSSGMQLRLAFAVSTSVSADVLIMDEWLSVGDAAFNAKAAKRLESFVDKASVLIIASHDMALIDRICTRKLVLEQGRILSDELLPDDELSASNPA